MKGRKVVALLLLTMTAYGAQANLRIRKGVRAGDLTVKQARHLIKLQNKVQRLKTNALLDGCVTIRERRRIAKAERKLKQRWLVQFRHPRYSGLRPIG